MDLSDDEKRQIQIKEILQKQGVRRVTYRAPEYNMPSLLTDRPTWFSLFFNRPGEKKIVSGHRVLAFCRFIKFRSARGSGGEVKNV